MWLMRQSVTSMSDCAGHAAALWREQPSLYLSGLCNMRSQQWPTGTLCCCSIKNPLHALFVHASHLKLLTAVSPRSCGICAS